MRIFLILAALLFALPAQAQEALLLRPERVFDGVDPRPHTGWSVLVRGNRIEAAGPDVQAPADARVIDLPGQTLMPGMIEGHSHLFLHPYSETSWDDQVLHEPLALRTARAVNHARATLMAGFTTVRDLGTEGAGYADAGLRRAINEGIVVDTHVQRLARRLGLTRQADPIGIERALMPLFPQDDWALLSHLLIWHGRRVCSARKPACGDCVIAAVCPSAGRPT